MKFERATVDDVVTILEEHQKTLREECKRISTAIAASDHGVSTASIGRILQMLENRIIHVIHVKENFIDQVDRINTGKERK